MLFLVLHSFHWPLLYCYYYAECCISHQLAFLYFVSLSFCDFMLVLMVFFSYYSWLNSNAGFFPFSLTLASLIWMYSIPYVFVTQMVPVQDLILNNMQFFYAEKLQLSLTMTITPMLGRTFCGIISYSCIGTRLPTPGMMTPIIIKSLLFYAHYNLTCNSSLIFAASATLHRQLPFLPVHFFILGHTLF